MIYSIWLALLALFVLKLLWNVAIPLVMEIAYRRWRNKGGKEPSGVTMMMIIELLLLFALSLMFYFLPQEFLVMSVWKFFLFGIISIVASYILNYFVWKLVVVTRK
jgi:hypothetical protein